MNIIDYSWKKEIQRNNSPLLPRNVRGLIIGKSNCGKTILLINLLLNNDWMDYNHLYVFGKSLHQEEYKILQLGFAKGLSKQQISNIFNGQETLKNAGISALEAINQFTGPATGKIRSEFYTDCSMIPDPSILESRDKNLLILDDCFLDKQNKAEVYYTRGRHNNCDTLYISQSYFHLPRHTIRENSNFIILFPQDAKNLTHIHADHCSTDLSVKEFKDFCDRVWTSGKHNFVTIDLTSSRLNGKFRKNLDCFYIPDTQP